MDIYNNFSLHYRFLIKNANMLFQNIEYVHPLKQEDIYKIITAWQPDKNVKKIVIFGSAVRFNCNSYSDIDLYAELEDPNRIPKIPYSKVMSEVDLLYDVPKESNIWKSISRDGIVVFER